MKKIFLTILLLTLTINIVVYAANFQEGVAAFGNNNYAKAEIYFRKALRDNYQNNKVRYFLAVTLTKNNKYSEAKRLYRQILDQEKTGTLAQKSAIGLNNLGENVTIPKSNYKRSSLFKKRNNANNPDRIVIHTINNGDVIILQNVRLNNRVSGNFVLDTGASLTVISPAIARKLRINTIKAPKVELNTANGKVIAPIVSLESVSINGLIANNIQAAVQNLGTLDGLLGISYLKNFKVTIDRPNNELILERN